ncbi:hypothetical protein J2S47_001118 [Streptomyces griseoviridis]|uniref:SGNH hydrolase-type esterase domain-containing protein n=1 Tax=Streptomyces griseoviridis TaxID=45398 RepID=A0ABT9LDN9_STRGD|nr:hypothetical protein [Streptomyces griseoviridis]
MADPVGGGWRGSAGLLAASPAGQSERRAECRDLGVGGAQTRDVREAHLPAALALRPDLASVVVGADDTLRRAFGIRAVATRLDAVYAAFTGQGAVLLTACLPGPGTMLGLPGAPARPPARRQRAVNAVVHALSERSGALHLHVREGDWVTGRAMRSADRLHPGERGTGDWPCGPTRCSPRAGPPGVRRPRPSRIARRPPVPPACGGWPPPAPAGWPGAPPTCWPSSSPWPPTNSGTAHGIRAPAWTCAPPPRCRRP